MQLGIPTKQLDTLKSSLQSLGSAAQWDIFKSTEGDRAEKIATYTGAGIGGTAGALSVVAVPVGCMLLKAGFVSAGAVLLGTGALAGGIAAPLVVIGLGALAYSAYQRVRSSPDERNSIDRATNNARIVANVSGGVMGGAMLAKLFGVLKVGTASQFAGESSNLIVAQGGRLIFAPPVPACESLGLGHLFLAGVKGVCSAVGGAIAGRALLAGYRHIQHQRQAAMAPALRG
jgi:hypothetical protein